MSKEERKFPKCTLSLESEVPLKQKKKVWVSVTVPAFLKSLFFRKIQKTGQSFTTSDEPNQLQIQEEKEVHLRISLKPSLRLYPCGKLAVPKTYLVRDLVTEDFATIDAKLAKLLFNITEV